MNIVTIEFILDSQAWIEYFLNSRNADKVESLFERRAAATPTVVIAELSNFFERKKVKKWNKAFLHIQAKTTIIGLNSQIAEKAGVIKNEIRQEFKNNFSLIDAIILTTAREYNAKVVTGDYHFKKIPNTVFLE